MIRKDIKYKLYFSALLFCLLQIAGIDVYAQTPVQTNLQDSVSTLRQAPQARARRHREGAAQATDTLQQKSIPLSKDSIPSLALPKKDIIQVDSLIADSLASLNKANLEKMQTKIPPVPPVLPKDSLSTEVPKKLWIPNSTKATWLAVIFPGGGQIYNRKYWKLPIIYGGFAGCAYALTWNTKMYKDYSQAYQDIMDSNPNTNSFQDLLPPNYNISNDQLKELLRKRKDTFRRYRDLSIFAFIGVYLISVIDAYVDAELSDFDITPDLSMRVEPTLMNDQFRNGNKSVGVQCSFRF